MRNLSKQEAEVRQLVENWAAAVREKNRDAILAHHSSDFVMFDVPPPFQSVGLEAYKKTWELFFANTKPGVFDVQELHVTAGETVAFCYATMKCEDRVNGEYVPLNFRLSIGLEKVDGQWTIKHEHHSVPSD